MCRSMFLTKLYSLPLLLVRLIKNILISQILKLRYANIIFTAKQRFELKHHRPIPFPKLHQLQNGGNRKLHDNCISVTKVLILSSFQRLLKMTQTCSAKETGK